MQHIHPNVSDALEKKLFFDDIFSYFKDIYLIFFVVRIFFSTPFLSDQHKNNHQRNPAYILYPTDITTKQVNESIRDKCQNDI